MTTPQRAKKTWRGVPSLIAIERRSPQPLYQQIYEYFRLRITRGDLRAGQRVPSTRELARELRISRLPVLNAYSQLIAEGHFQTRTGSGTFVASSIDSKLAGKEQGNGESPLQRRSISLHARMVPKFERPSWAEHLGAFQVGQPELKTFPMHIWSRLLSRYSRELRVPALQYGDPMGLAELREILAVYLRTSRAVRCGPEQIMIVNGSQQALDITTRVLLDPGAPAWVEEPGYWLIHHVLASGGCEAIPVPVDAEGLNVKTGAKLKRTARAVFVAPSHQYPMGVTMGATRRFQLLEWAHKSGSWIVEDDYDSEYRYDSKPITSLQGLDDRDRVIYTGTLSKVLFPALRLGFIVIPLDLVERFAAVRQAMDICPSHSSQAVLAAFIREGHFARHIRRMRKLYEERRRVLLQELERQLGASYEVMGTAAGMHLTLVLDDKFCDRKIAEKAIKRQLWLSALSLSYIGPSPRQGLVLGFGNTASTQIPRAVGLLKEILQQRGADRKNQLKDAAAG
ncbi:MAG TPA: PLP-dependent aminotransferase family protein [Terriglobales bacterium]|nr:PLP-dependent aminotransferase family protein [Terriglobales bacterium]